MTRLYAGPSFPKGLLTKEQKTNRMVWFCSGNIRIIANQQMPEHLTSLATPKLGLLVSVVSVCF